MKNETVNGIKVKVFTKKDLMQKLGFEEDESKLIMKYQKTFPELLQDDIEDFVIDSRLLWDQLDKPYTKYADWIKKKVMKSKWLENKDYITISKKIDLANKGYKEIDTHLFTVDMAKNVCMMENTDKGRLTRSYFILMEKALRNMDDWLIVREPQKEGYKEMCVELDKVYKAKNPHEKTIPFHIFTNEANMINVALLGLDAKNIRRSLEIKDCQTREWLNTEVNKALYELQLINSSLISSGMSFENRKQIIENTCNNKYIGLKNNINQELKIA